MILVLGIVVHEYVYYWSYLWCVNHLIYYDAKTRGLWDMDVCIISLTFASLSRNFEKKGVMWQ